MTAHLSFFGPWAFKAWAVVLVLLVVVLLVDAWRSARVDLDRAFRGDRERVR